MKVGIPLELTGFTSAQEQKKVMRRDALLIDTAPWVLVIPFALAALMYLAIKYQPWLAFSVRAPSKRRALAGWLIGGGGTFVAVFAFCFLPYIHKVVEIRGNGQRAMAEVQEIHMRPHKGDPGYRARYRYAVSRRDGTASYFDGDDWLMTACMSDAQQTGQVPIAYVVDDPGTSMGNCGDFVFQRALQLYLPFALFVSFLAALVIGWAMAALFKTNVLVRRERRFRELAG